MPKHGIFYHRFNQRQKIHNFICFIIFVIGCPVLIKSSHSDFTVTQTDSDTQSHSHTSNKISSTSCGHQNPVVSQINHVYVESKVRERRQVEETHHNLRIHLTYDSSMHQLPADQQYLIKNSVMGTAIQYWENALKTRRLSKPILLARSCADGDVFRTDTEDISDRQTYCIGGCSPVTMCGDSVVPEHHLQGCRLYDTWNEKFIIENSSAAGVTDADFLLYVAASDTARCDSSVAYATYCQLEVEYDRPIAGFINICPQAISTHETDLALTVAKVKHEILHALGFSLSLYGFYRDSNGNPLTQREPIGNRPPLGADKSYIFSDRVVRIVWRRDWLTTNGTVEWPVNMMVTPRVTEEARKHFNCSLLEGAELENQGSTGTRLTHWEKRVFENEMMTGIYTQNPVVSRITLALMEDTGWYMANYSYAETLDWGKNLGCEFAMKSCLEWIQKREASDESAHPYCTEVRSNPLRTHCNSKRTALSVCNLLQYSQDLSIFYRYSAKSPRLGGGVSLADYCPYLQEFDWKKEATFVRGSECYLTSNAPHVDTNLAIEYYGKDSKCFDQVSPFQMSRCSTVFVSNNYGAGCYKYKCVAGQGLYIYVAGKEFRCYKKGQLLDVKVTTTESYFEGALVCPACGEVCAVGICPPESEPPPSTVEDQVKDIPCVSEASQLISSSISFYFIMLCIASLLFIL